MTLFLLTSFQHENHALAMLNSYEKMTYFIVGQKGTKNPLQVYRVLEPLADLSWTKALQDMSHPFPSHPFVDICHAHMHTQTHAFSEWYENTNLNWCSTKCKKMEVLLSAYAGCNPKWYKKSQNHKLMFNKPSY